MPTILCYVDSHGFGHATRVIAVLEALPPDWRILIRTNGPVWLWRDNFNRPHELFPSPMDLSPLQQDPFNLDWPGTRARALKVLEAADDLIAQQAEWARQQDIGLVLSDIPPLAFPVAAAAGVPSIGMTNFAWDWIYAGLTLAHGRDPYLVNTIRSHYQHCDILLRLPFNRGLETFAYTEDCPLVVRPATTPKEQVRALLGELVPTNKPWVLLSFGGIPFEALPAQALLQMNNYVFLMTTPYSQALRTPMQHAQVPQLWLLPPTFLDHASLVRAVDVVITKPGYGIVSECLANATRVVYTPREGFPEYYPLRDALADSGLAVEMTVEALLSGAWQPYLKAVLAQSGPGYLLPTNGAQVVAKKLAAMLVDQTREV